MATAPQQPMIDDRQPDIMGAVARKGKPSVPPQVEQAKEQIKQIMRAQNITPQQIMRGAQMAELAIRDKTMYPAMVQMAVKEGLIQPNQIGPGIDYKFLAGAVAAGKIAQMIMDEGGL